MSKKAGRPAGTDKGSTEKIDSMILNHLTQHPGSNPTTFLAERLQLTRQAVLARLTRMQEEGVLHAEGAGKGRIYFTNKPTQ